MTSDYDPNYVHEPKYFVVGVKVVVINGEKVLVMKRSSKAGAGGKWSLSGGALETGESVEECGRRETKEETEMEVVEIHVFSARVSENDAGDSVVIIGCLSRVEQEKVVLNWEHDEYRWLTLQEALELDLTDDARFFLMEYEKFQSTFD